MCAVDGLRIVIGCALIVQSLRLLIMRAIDKVFAMSSAEWNGLRNASLGPVPPFGLFEEVGISVVAIPVDSAR